MPGATRTRASGKARRKASASMRRAASCTATAISPTNASVRSARHDETSSAAARRASWSKIGAVVQLSAVLRVKKCWSRWMVSRSLLDDAGADAVGALGRLAPDRAGPEAPVPEGRIVGDRAAPVDRHAVAVGEQHAAADAADRLVEPVEARPGRRGSAARSRWRATSELGVGEPSRRRAFGRVEPVQRRRSAARKRPAPIAPARRRRSPPAPGRRGGSAFVRASILPWDRRPCRSFVTSMPQEPAFCPPRGWAIEAGRHRLGEADMRGGRRAPRRGGATRRRRSRSFAPGSGERLSTAAAVREQHGKDPTYHAGRAPDAVAFARSTEEVAEIVARLRAPRRAGDRLRHRDLARGAYRGVAGGRHHRPLRHGRDPRGQRRRPRLPGARRG